MADGLIFKRVSSLRPKAPPVQDAGAAVRAALARVQPALAALPKNSRVAVTCGSRGIDRIAEVVREACAVLREAGACPFVVPAMGSHGGATAEGQRRVVADYGVVENFVGAPVVSSMETVRLGRTPEGIDVYMDRAAFEAGHVLAVNRVKLHTDFSGEVESGLMKVLAVGLGKQDGAASYHRNSLATGFDRVILSMGRHILNSGRIVAGLGLVENDRHALCEIEAVPGPDIEALDRRLLRRARELHPRLPFACLDLLIVDEIGKNVSGAGMDTKVIGRSVHPDRVPDDMALATRIRRIYVRDLTPESEGNAIGMGLADVMHERIARKLDLNATYINSRTALGFAAVSMPMRFPNDREAIEFLLANLGSPDPRSVRAAWIRNTLSVTDFFATEAATAELRDASAHGLGDTLELNFDSIGDLVPPLFQ